MLSMKKPHKVNMFTNTTKSILRSMHVRDLREINLRQKINCREKWLL